MTTEERKRALGYGGGAAIQRLTKRSKSHVHYVIGGVRNDIRVQRAAVRVASKNLGRTVNFSEMWGEVTRAGMKRVSA